MSKKLETGVLANSMGRPPIVLKNADGIEHGRLHRPFMAGKHFKEHPEAPRPDFPEHPEVPAERKFNFAGYLADYGGRNTSFEEIHCGYEYCYQLESTIGEFDVKLRVSYSFDPSDERWTVHSWASVARTAIRPGAKNGEDFEFALDDIASKDLIWDDGDGVFTRFAISQKVFDFWRFKVVFLAREHQAKFVQHDSTPSA